MDIFFARSFKVDSLQSICLYGALPQICESADLFDLVLAHSHHHSAFFSFRSQLLIPTLLPYFSLLASYHLISFLAFIARKPWQVLCPGAFVEIEIQEEALPDKPPPMVTILSLPPSRPPTLPPTDQFIQIHTHPSRLPHLSPFDYPSIHSCDTMFGQSVSPFVEYLFQTSSNYLVSRIAFLFPFA